MKLFYCNNNEEYNVIKSSAPTLICLLGFTIYLSENVFWINHSLTKYLLCLNTWLWFYLAPKNYKNMYCLHNIFDPDLQYIIHFKLASNCFRTHFLKEQIHCLKFSMKLMPIWQLLYCVLEWSYQKGPY